MRHRTVGVIAVLAALAPARAWAPCHLVSIVEVFGGTASCPRAQYVVLELLDNGENFVGGWSILISTNEIFGTFAADVPNGMAGDKVLMATPEAEALFGITADHTAPGTVSIESPDGVVTFDCSGDEVHYGAVPMSESPPLAPDVAIKWTGAMWVQGAPAPVNNAGDTGTPGACPVEDGGVGLDGALDVSDGPALVDGLAAADGPQPVDGPMPDVAQPDGPLPPDAPAPADGPTPADGGLADAPIGPDAAGAAEPPEVDAVGPDGAAVVDVQPDAPADAFPTDTPAADVVRDVPRDGQLARRLDGSHRGLSGSAARHG
jgi:hypothetical protein